MQVGLGGVDLAVLPTELRSERSLANHLERELPARQENVRIGL